MTTEISLPEEAVSASIPQVSHLTEVAETIRDDALDAARQKLSPLRRDTHLKDLFQDAAFFDYLKYELASGVTKALAVHDQHVLAIYTRDPSANPDSEMGEDMPLDATVHLLVRVTTSSAALEAFIDALDRALTDSLKEMPSPQFAQRRFILDVILITDDEVEVGSGHVVLLSSIFAPPLRIWQRE